MLHYSHILTFFSPPFTPLLCSLLLISSFQTFLCLCFEFFLFCEPLSCPFSRWACLGLWTGAQGTYHCIHLWRYWPFALTRDFNSQEVPREGPGRSHNSRSPSLKDVERLSLVQYLYNTILCTGNCSSSKFMSASDMLCPEGSTSLHSFTSSYHSTGSSSEIFLEPSVL